MVICIFSDIHGNGPAFMEGRKAIVAENADLNIFLGDLCGYYYDQIQILDGLRSIDNLISLGGNHDAMFLEIKAGNQSLRKQYLSQYGHCMEHLLEEDNADLVAWLGQRSFSHYAIDRGFSCFHGSPLDPRDGYVYPDASLECFGGIQERFIFLGHTHYRMYRTQDRVHFINPGSLGQPRDGGPATYAVVDTHSCEVVFRKVFFDKELLREQIRALGDEGRYLEAILER
jgi:putative phosphoesterase